MVFVYYHKFELLNLQGSVETYRRYDGMGIIKS